MKSVNKCCTWHSVDVIAVVEMYTAKYGATEMTALIIIIITTTTPKIVIHSHRHDHCEHPKDCHPRHTEATCTVGTQKTTVLAPGL